MLAVGRVGSCEGMLLYFRAVLARLALCWQIGLSGYWYGANLAEGLSVSDRRVPLGDLG